MKNHGPIRFGCHRFLNSRPFSDYLITRAHDLGIHVRFDYPARLADALKAGELDMAFIPSIEYPGIPKGRVVPGVSISSTGVVKTVLLICKKKMNDVKSVAIDQRSRTSVALLKLILKARGIHATAFSPMSPDVPSMLEKNDAALVIGDAAFKVHGIGLETYDLGAEWFRITRKPFVHAVIVASGISRIDLNLLNGLHEAKNSLKNRIGLIAEEESVKLNIPVEDCVDYLMNRISYNLGPGEIEGLEEFYKMAARDKLIDPDKISLRFLEAA